MIGPGYTEEYARHIFKQLEGVAKYGFLESRTPALRLSIYLLLGEMLLSGYVCRGALEFSVYSLLTAFPNRDRHPKAWGEGPASGCEHFLIEVIRSENQKENIG